MRENGLFDSGEDFIGSSIMQETIRIIYNFFFTKKENIPCDLSPPLSPAFSDFLILEGSVLYWHVLIITMRLLRLLQQFFVLITLSFPVLCLVLCFMFISIYLKISNILHFDILYKPYVVISAC